MNKHFGGTGITLNKLKEYYKSTINVDGTTYKLEDWFKECDLFDTLIVNESLVWVPYCGAERHGILREIVPHKRLIKHFTEDADKQDWWISEPYLKVELDGNLYYVYEISYYKKLRRKTQRAHIAKVFARGKQKFLSQKDIAEHKKQEAIQNSINKRSK